MPQLKKPVTHKQLTAEDILDADDLQKEACYIDVWGGELFIRTMTGQERDAFENDAYEIEGLNVKVKRDNVRARLVAHTAVDKDGKRLFTSAQIEALGKKNCGALDKLFGIAQRLNGMSRADIEDLIKNFVPSPGDDSHTD